MEKKAGKHDGDSSGNGQKQINRRYCSIKEISEYTSLSIKTLYDWAGMGRIPSIKIGRRVLFDLNDIDKVMDKLKRTTGQAEKIVRKIAGGIENNEL